MVDKYETVNNYTYGDIQTAIWNLLFTNLKTEPSSYYIPITPNDNVTYNSENVVSILTDSLTSINNYPNMKTMICKTNKIIGNLMIPNYNDYIFNNSSQILCISTVLDCKCCACCEPEYIYVFNMSSENTTVEAYSQHIFSSQVVTYNMPSNYSVVSKGITLNMYNNGLILKTTGVYEANFSICGFPLIGNVISFKLINVPSVNGIPAIDFNGASTITGSVYKTINFIDIGTLTGCCKFIANAGDTLYLANNTSSQVILIMDTETSSMREPTVNASLDVFLIEKIPSIYSQNSLHIDISSFTSNTMEKTLGFKLINLIDHNNNQIEENNIIEENDMEDFKMEKNW